MAERAGHVELNGRGREQGDRSSLDRYLRSQETAVDGTITEGEDRARPLEFDESGFPIAQRPPSFVKRVARLLTP